ncbi:MAG: DNA helicase [Cycloclasticus sp.]|nr:MAG: DNA helicase [Cycloclasticus sp.]
MNFTDIFTAIKSGTVVLTVNQRLARHLLNKVEQAYIIDGVAAWASPDIVSFDSWLLQAWEQRFNRDGGEPVHPKINKTLLAPEQTLVLWEKVIRNGSGAELLNVSATAKAANKARQLGVQWDIAQTNSHDVTSHLDLAMFEQWHTDYKTELAKGDWVDKIQLLECVSAMVEQSFIDCPDQVVLAGFDVYTPTQQSFWELLQAKGCDVTEYSPSVSASQAQVIKTSDEMEEAALMAQWARERLQENPAASTPSIGIVALDLNAQRETIEAAFKAAFYPSKTYAVDVPFEKPYNVSLGLALSTYVPIQQSLRLLQFFSQPLPLSELCLLLRSSFISAGQAEWGQRAKLEVVLRKRGFMERSLKQLRNALQPFEDEVSPCPNLLLSLNEVAERLDARPNRVMPSAWVSVFRALLTAAGVQGDRELSSTEYQVFQAWDDVLRTFATLDAVHKVIDYGTALSALRRLLGERVFQPETPPAPIQIMGLMEAAGHTFDALWVCGLHDKAWPPAPQPNPFLPIVEQRKQGLVQSSAEHQYQYAKQVTQHWASAAQTVVFSYSQSNGDTAQAISPLIEDYQTISKEQLLQQQPINRVEQRLNSDAMSQIEDITGPVVQTTTIAKGGVGVIKDQAACPFKAFAHHRLRARAMEEPEPGIDARLRGSLVHTCLEKIWQQIRTHQILCDLSADEQKTLVYGIVTAVIQQESMRTPILKKAFGQLESQRMTQLLLDWLLIDAQREPFDVTATELKQTVTVGQLQLNTVIDRVDTLQDGSIAIIDYKTGESSINKWFGERPEEPQLPLYNVFGSNDIQADVRSMSFAQLKKGKIKYEGLSDSTENFSGLKRLDESKKADKPDWDSQMAYWKDVLGGLSDEFVAGDARVNPTKKACDYCDLTSLCRINEQGELMGADDE